MINHILYTSMTETQTEYLKTRDTYPVSDEVKRQYDYRIREKARKMLKDLTTMAQYLPEDQMAQIFTKENMQDLIKNILNAKKTYSDSPKYGTGDILNNRTFELSHFLAFAGIEAAYFNVHQRLRTIAHGKTLGFVKPEDKVAFLVNMRAWENQDIKPSEFEIEETYPFLKDPKKLKED